MGLGSVAAVGASDWRLIAVSANEIVAVLGCLNLVTVATFTTTYIRTVMVRL